MKLAVGINENVFLFEDIEVIVARNVAETANLALPAETIGTFDIEKQISHYISSS